MEPFLGLSRDKRRGSPVRRAASVSPHRSNMQFLWALQEERASKTLVGMGGKGGEEPGLHQAYPAHRTEARMRPACFVKLMRRIELVSWPLTGADTEATVQDMTHHVTRRSGKETAPEGSQRGRLQERGSHHGGLLGL